MLRLRRLIRVMKKGRGNGRDKEDEKRNGERDECVEVSKKVKVGRRENLKQSGEREKREDA